MTLLPEPYSPRRIATLGVWREAGHSIKAYGIHRDPDVAGPILSDPVTASVRATVRDVLDEYAGDPRAHGLGYCLAHGGEGAVWLLVDWWLCGGIVGQRLLSAPLAHPDTFTPVDAPALACVWELAVIAHERDAWVRHMLTERPDADAYLQTVLPAGRY